MSGGAEAAREGRPRLVQDISRADMPFLHLSRHSQCLRECEQAEGLSRLPVPNFGGCSRGNHLLVVEEDIAQVMASS